MGLSTFAIFFCTSIVVTVVRIPVVKCCEWGNNLALPLWCCIFCWYLFRINKRKAAFDKCLQDLLCTLGVPCLLWLQVCDMHFLYLYFLYLFLIESEIQTTPEAKCQTKIVLRQKKKELLVAGPLERARDIILWRLLNFCWGCSSIYFSFYQNRFLIAKHFVLSLLLWKLLKLM